ncbi:DUF3037 domain-containing protein [Chromohalobacter sp. 48-RD10]|uniref:DUF3037 domain-containing protein n=1 Tax=Chromohalobacter sp. 48-RD10 TaxID=2994063 RepID=UPI002469227B|nr:DUF3037 domain-containing protein [Chromohalobacter sp. 48-RD10]
MSTFCNYAVLRFQPYPETGEFANLGIVMLCSNGQFLQRVETRTRKRVTDFFDKLDPSIFRRARHEFADEVKRVAELANANAGDFALQMGLFKHLIAPSETMFRFGPPGTIASSDPAKTLDELFNRYVHHDFDQREEVETTIKRRLNILLKEQFVDRIYREERLGDELYHVTFPFVWRHHEHAPRQAIRPLSFDLDDPKSILDKGDRWIMQMNRLTKHGGMPEDTVFVCQAPQSQEAKRIQSYREITAELANTQHIRVIPQETPVSQMREMLAETVRH